MEAETELLIVGNTYQCSSPLLEQHFEGIIEKVYDSSALVEVSHSSSIDQARVQELNNKIVIPFSLIDIPLHVN